MSIIEKLGITPGPWTFDERLGVFSLTAKNKVGEGISVASEVLYQDGPVIAAAPEMLEALIHCREYFEREYPNNRGLMLNVVEKATGKSWAEIKELI